MKPSMKFGIGATVIIAAVTLMMVEGVKQKSAADDGLHDLGVKVAAKVVKGSIARQGGRRVDFSISDGTHTFPVTYVGMVPDTFTDENDIEVVVDGKYGRDGVFVATDVIAKCGSRYEAAWEEDQVAAS